MRLNFTANSFVSGSTNRGIAPTTFSVKLAGRKRLKSFWTPQQTTSFLKASIGKVRPELFYKAWKAQTSKMRLNFTANRFIFGRTNCGVAPTTFSVKLAGRELPKSVWISRQTASLLNEQIVELRHNIFFKTCKQRTSIMRLNFTANSFVSGRTNCGIAPTTFSAKLAGRESLKSFWTPLQTTSFLNASIEKVRPELFYKAWKAQTSKMRLNFTANRGIAPKTFSVNLAGRELPECVWISRQSASFLDAQIVELRPQLFL